MKYPVRHKNHVNETMSWAIAKNIIPQSWILRELSKKDYGVDAYLELILNDKGLVTGDVCYIQLKSTEKIKWKNNISKLPNIKKSTINYWLNLPAPVFIFYIDLSSKELYFCCINKFIRENYTKYYEAKKTMSIDFHCFNKLEIESEINKKANLTTFIYSYFSEKNYREIENSLRTLITHLKTYLMFILSNQHRDEFLLVEGERIFSLIDLYKLLKTISAYSFLEWKCSSLEEIYKQDYNAFNEINELHELFLTKILIELQKQLVTILKFYKHQFTVVEKDYRFINDYYVFKKLESIDVDLLERDPYSFDLDYDLSY